MKKLFILTLFGLITHLSSFALTPILGTFGACTGGISYLSDSLSAGGTWSSSNTAIASVDGSGEVFGIAAGIATITYTEGGSYVTASFTVSATPVAITGTTHECSGASVTLTDGTTGGTWSSLPASIATVGSLTGVVTGVTSGIAYIYYTISAGCYTMKMDTVNAGGPAPAAITGSSTVCLGSSITLADATGGGTWSSGSTAIATVSSGGVVTGVSAGTVTITYGVTGTCGSLSIATKTVTVTSGGTAGFISGPSSVCTGSSITLTDTLTGGAWSSSSTGTATVSSGGVVTGAAAGTVTITYTLAGTCGSGIATRTVTVTSGATAGTITGASTVAASATITLADAITGGTWSSSNTAVATVNPYTGVVTGVSTGTVTITYAVTGSCGTAYATTTITVTAFDGISGNINFTGAAYYGPVKVWLIKYDTATHFLTAVDSSTVYCSSGTSAYYQFTGLATDSFRVKAASEDSAFSSTGYLPTYHDSSYYWHDAFVIYHTSGTSDVNKNINMAYGTVTTGPGFIAGDVMTGANKSTSGTTSPVVGLLIYAVNSTTGAILQQTYTDATGSYSFGGLPYGTYFVHPELINFTTVDYTSITLSTAGPIKTGASFIQHTVSHTITPGNVGVANVQSQAASVVAYPNPASGKLNIVWTETTNETGNVSITDVTGREVYKTAIKMNTGSGMGQVDLSALTNGLYIITVKSANIDYNNKIQVQH